MKATSGRISAKRLLPLARAAGYEGSDRNFRRLVAGAKKAWRREHPRGRRPAVWAPGETLVIDWGMRDGVHLFCTVLAWSRFRFVRFATDETASTTLSLLAECFEILGGIVPPEQSRAVAAAAPGLRQLVEIVGADHNDLALLNGRDLIRAVADLADETATSSS